MSANAYLKTEVHGASKFDLHLMVVGGAIIIGFGRVGRLLSEMLEEHGVAHLAIEHNPANVTPWRHRGRPVCRHRHPPQVLRKAAVGRNPAARRYL